MVSQTSEPILLSRLIENLKSAATCCNGLAHAQQRPQFLMLQQSLDALVETATKLAVSGAPSRQKVLRQIDAINRDASRQVKH